MGLLLSILVECVGVLEVIAWCHHLQSVGLRLQESDVNLLEIKHEYRRQFMESTNIHHAEDTCHVCHDELLQQLRDTYDATMFPEFEKKDKDLVSRSGNVKQLITENGDCRDSLVPCDGVHGCESTDCKFEIKEALLMSAEISSAIVVESDAISEITENGAAMEGLQVALNISSGIIFPLETPLIQKITVPKEPEFKILEADTGPTNELEINQALLTPLDISKSVLVTKEIPIIEPSIVQQAFVSTANIVKDIIFPEIDPDSTYESLQPSSFSTLETKTIDDLSLAENITENSENTEESLPLDDDFHQNMTNGPEYLSVPEVDDPLSNETAITDLSEEFEPELQFETKDSSSAEELSEEDENNNVRNHKVETNWLQNSDTSNNQKENENVEINFEQKDNTTSNIEMEKRDFIEATRYLASSDENVEVMEPAEKRVEKISENRKLSISEEAKDQFVYISAEKLVEIDKGNHQKHGNNDLSIVKADSEKVGPILESVEQPGTNEEIYAMTNEKTTEVQISSPNEGDFNENDLIETKALVNRFEVAETTENFKEPVEQSLIETVGDAEIIMPEKVATLVDVENNSADIQSKVGQTSDQRFVNELNTFAEKISVVDESKTVSEVSVNQDEKILKEMCKNIDQLISEECIKEENKLEDLVIGINLVDKTTIDLNEIQMSPKFFENIREHGVSSILTPLEVSDNSQDVDNKTDEVSFKKDEDQLKCAEITNEDDIPTNTTEADISTQNIEELENNVVPTQEVSSNEAIEDQIVPEQIIPEEEISIDIPENVIVIANGRAPVLESPTESIEEVNPIEFVIDYNFNLTDEPESEPHHNDVGLISNDFSSVVYNILPPHNQEVHFEVDGTASDEISELSMFTESELNESGIPTGAVYIIDDGVTQRHVYIDRTTNSVVEFIPEIQMERAGSPYPTDHPNILRDQLAIPDSVVEVDSNACSDNELTSKDEDLFNALISENSVDDVVLFEASRTQVPSFDLRSASQESAYDLSTVPEAVQRGNIPDFWNRTISSQNSSLDIPMTSCISVQEHSPLRKQITLSTNLPNLPHKSLSKTDSSLSMGSENQSFDDNFVVQSTINVQQRQGLPKLPTFEEEVSSPIPSITEDCVDSEVPVNPYNEQFLNSLDGIRFSPISRDRRKTFKKRSCSSSSNSSVSSRASRDEELKLLTSLEESEQGVTYEQMRSVSPDDTKRHSKRKRRHRKRHNETNTETTNKLDCLIDDESKEIEKAHASYEQRRTLRQLTKVASFEDVAANVENNIQKDTKEESSDGKNKSGNAFWSDDEE